MKNSITPLKTGSIFALCLITSISFAQQLGGLALYTVRDDMTKDAKSTLRKVAKIGYKNIEAAGYENGKYYNMPPAEFKAFLATLNLNGISTHQSAVTLENADQMFIDAKAAGFTYFVVPIPPMGMFTYDEDTQTLGMTGTVKRLAEILNKLGKKAYKAGLQLLYHNHDFEFKKNENDIVPIDYLLQNCDAKYVNFQMDLYWVTRAEANPIIYFKKYPNRFKMWHVKDMDAQGRFAPVGTGSIDFAEILKYKERSGMEYYMVEQDITFDGMLPFEAIKISRKAIEKLGFK